MRILIISLNALGDTYLSCSALSILRDHFRKPIIDFVVNKKSEFFIEQFNLNKIFYLKHKSIKEIIRTYYLLRKGKYDIAFSFFPGRVNTFFLIGSNAKIKSGFINLRRIDEWHDKAQTIYLKGRDVPFRKQIWKPKMNYLERIKICLISVGVVVKDLYKPRFSNPDLTLNNFNSDVVIHFTSSRFYRNLKSQEFQNLVYHLSTKMNLRVNLLGSKKDFIRFDKIRDSKNVQFVSDPKIDILIATLLKTKVFIGVDSFPIHLADAYNIKTIGIFGGTRPESVFQSMENKFIVQKRVVSDISCKNILDVFEFAFYN